ncbi:MAG: MarR family transcriptional regulator [Acidobacteriota bacterium]
MGPNTSTSDTRTVLDGIRRLVQSLRESSRWAEKHVGMSGAQLFVLQKLAEGPGASLNELAARTHTHQSSVSTIIARLVEKGLVVRRRSPSDGRSVTLTLSPRGQRVGDRSPNAAQERLIAGIERLSAARRRALASALGALGDAMDAADPEPAMFFEERGPKRRSPKHA